MSRPRWVGSHLGSVTIGCICSGFRVPEACARARAALDALDAPGVPVPSAEDQAAVSADENRVWITACTDPFGGRAEIVPYLHRIAGGSLRDRGKVGGAAWILDETELAVRAPDR